MNRYFVLLPTGERYGPADLATLNQWAAEHRIQPTSRLADEMTGNVLSAAALPGIVFPNAVPPPSATLGVGPIAPFPPQPPIASPGSSYIPTHGLGGDDGSKELWASIGLALAAPVVGLLMMYGILLAVGGIGSAWRAYRKGKRWAMLALALNVVALPVAFYMRFVLRYELFR